jgi:hypothetical protein
MPYPSILNELVENYDFVNVEYIGGKIIEVHLRPNPDFIGHNSSYVRPTYVGEEPDIDERYQKFILRPDGARAGFIIDKR